MQEAHICTSMLTRDALHIRIPYSLLSDLLDCEQGISDTTGLVEVGISLSGSLQHFLQSKRLRCKLSWVAIQEENPSTLCAFSTEVEKIDVGTSSIPVNLRRQILDIPHAHMRSIVQGCLDSFARCWNYNDLQKGSQGAIPQYLSEVNQPAGNSWYPRAMSMRIVVNP